MKRSTILMFMAFALCAHAADKPSGKKEKPAMPAGLVSHYTFDTTEEGGLTPCQIDTNFNARTSNVRWSQAWNKSGYLINGSNSRIIIKDHKRLASPRFTLSMHFKTYKLDADDRVFLSKGYDQGYYLSILGSNEDQGRSFGRICFEIQGKRCVSDKPLNDNAWYNVTVTVDEKIARMYIDGVKQKSEAILKKAFTPVGDDLEVGNPEIKVVEKGKKKTRGFDGSVDELMIFNRALGEKEVADLFYCSVPHYNRKSVQWRINDLDELLERKLITKEFYDNRMKELMVE